MHGYFLSSQVELHMRLSQRPSRYNSINEICVPEEYGDASPKSGDAIPIVSSPFSIGLALSPKSEMHPACSHRLSDAAHNDTLRHTMEEVKGIFGHFARRLRGGLSRATGCLPTRDLTMLFVHMASDRADGPGAPLKHNKVEKHILTTGWQATRGT
jgi:hypothetical protein